MCLHTLNWPGLETLPVCVIDPVTGNVYTSSEPVPASDRSRLDRIEFKYVRSSVVLEQFSGAGRPRALDTLAYLAAVFGQHGDSGVTQDSDFVHVDTLLALIVVYPWCSNFQKARGAILRFLLCFRESPCWLCGFIRRDCICEGGAGVDVAGTMPIRRAEVPTYCDSSAQTDTQVVSGGTVGGGMPGAGGPITVLLPPGGIQLQPGMRIPLTGGLPGLGNTMSVGGMQPPLPPPMFFPPPPVPPPPMFHNGLTQPLWPPMPQPNQSLMQALSGKPGDNLFSKPDLSAPPPLPMAVPSSFPGGIPQPFTPYSSQWNARPPYVPPWSPMMRAPMPAGDSSVAPAQRTPCLPLFPPDARLTKNQSTQTRPLSFEKKCKRAREVPTTLASSEAKTPPKVTEGVDTKKPKIDTPTVVTTTSVKVAPVVTKPAPVEVCKTLEVNAKSLRDHCLWRLLDEDSDDGKSESSAVNTEHGKAKCDADSSNSGHTSDKGSTQENKVDVDGASEKSVHIDRDKVGTGEAEIAGVGVGGVDNDKMDTAKLHSTVVDTVSDGVTIAKTSESAVNSSDVTHGEIGSAIVDGGKDVSTDNADISDVKDDSVRIQSKVIENDCAATLSAVVDKVGEILDNVAASGGACGIIAAASDLKFATIDSVKVDKDSTSIDSAQLSSANNVKGDLLNADNTSSEGKHVPEHIVVSDDEEMPLIIDTASASATRSGQFMTSDACEKSADQMSKVASDEKEVAEILSSMSYVTSPQKGVTISATSEPHFKDAEMDRSNRLTDDISGHRVHAMEGVSVLRNASKENQNKVDLTAENGEDNVTSSIQQSAIGSNAIEKSVTEDGLTKQMATEIGNSKEDSLNDAIVEKANVTPKLAVADMPRKSDITTDLPIKPEQAVGEGGSGKDDKKATAVTVDKKVKVKKKVDKSAPCLDGVPVATTCEVPKSEQCYRRFEFLPTGERLYRCLHTSAAGHCFDSRAAADWHSRAHRAGKDSQNCNSHLFCHLCDYQIPMPRWYSLLRHLRVAHAVVMTTAARCCHLCGLSFSSDAALTTHEDYHYNSRYKCIYCGRTLATWRQVLRHLEDDCALQAAAGLRHLGCPYCPLVFHKRSMRSVHALSHTDAGLACAFCSAENNDQAAGGDGTWDVWRRLRRHYQQRHSRRMLAELSVLGTAPSKRVRPRCHVCNTDFRLQDDYRRHMVTAHDFVPRVYVECDECGKVFRNERTRDRHARTAHSMNLKCDKCSFVAMSDLILKLHEKTEHVERPHVCTECDKTFVSYRELKSHLVRHATHSIHMCKICDQEFGSVKDLHRHRQKEHELEGRRSSGHACPECTYTCYSRVNLREHMKRKHPDDEDDDNAMTSNRAKGPDHSYSNDTVKKVRLPVVSLPSSSRKKRPAPQKKTTRVKRSKTKVSAVTTKLPRRGGRKKVQTMKVREAIVEPVRPRMKRFACARLRTIENCRALKQLHPPLTDKTICHDSPSDSVLHGRSRFMTSVELDHSYCRLEVGAPPITPTVRSLMSPLGGAIVATPHVGDYEECSTALATVSPPSDTVSHDNVVEGASRLIALLRQQMEAGGGDSVPDAMQLLRQVTGSGVDATESSGGDDELANNSNDNIEQQLSDLLLSIQNDESGNVSSSAPTRQTASKVDAPLMNTDVILGRPGSLPMDLDDIELDEADYRLWDGIPISVTPDGKRHAAESATKVTAAVVAAKSELSASNAKRENTFLARINSSEAAKSKCFSDSVGVTTTVNNTTVNLPTSSGVTVIMKKGTAFSSADESSHSQTASSSNTAAQTYQQSISSTEVGVDRPVVGDLQHSPVKLITSTLASSYDDKPVITEILRTCTSPIRPTAIELQMSANRPKTAEPQLHQIPGAKPTATQIFPIAPTASEVHGARIPVSTSAAVQTSVLKTVSTTLTQVETSAVQNPTSAVGQADTAVAKTLQPVVTASVNDANRCRNVMTVMAPPGIDFDVPESPITKSTFIDDTPVTEKDVQP